MKRITILALALFGLATVASAQSRIEHFTLQSKLLGV